VFQNPDYVNRALQMTGSPYRVPGRQVAQSNQQRGAADQQEGMQKVGSLLSAVGNYYTGNWTGAAQDLRGLGSNAPPGQAPAPGALPQQQDQGGGASKGFDAMNLFGKLFKFGG
jgi:hypothetical protein